MTDSAPIRSILTLLLLPLVGIVVGLAPGTVQAQGSREQIRAELELTDRGLERAADHLRDRPCITGHSFLNRAREVQGRAREQFARGTDAGDRAALLLTREARKYVNEALRACGGGGRSGEDLLSLLRTTEDLIQDCAARLTATPDAEASRLLDAARGQLSRAREAYARKQLRPAIRRIAVARSLTQRALQHTRGQDAAAVDRVESVLDRSDFVIAEIRISLQETPDAKAELLLDQAIEQESRARSLWQAGRFRPAIRAATLARTLALEAHWEVTRTPDPEQLERSVAVVGDLLQDLDSDLRDNGTDQARALLEQARERWMAAKVALSGGDLPRASEEARAADALLRRAVEEAGER